MAIREATAADWPAIWPFFQEICAAGETIPYPRDIGAEAGRELWMTGPPGRTAVAVDAADDGRVLGTSNMYANRAGGGAHISSGSFMVASHARGRGVGRALGEDMLDWSRRSGFRGVQFNAVVECNHPAVALWKSLGFEVIGTVPESFHHPAEGYVGLHVMYQRL
ncbi:GNAT family N-acetyltransferase [Streptomyces sp. NPDC048172]|uniref:GNAT family N-acetyltransferase n=1 Tax=Streptomyces sp. NPDC048172 TaxID=3365505 RepID=UPI00371A02B4